MVKINPPKNTKKVHAFIGIVNYYRDMWDRRSHMLHTWTELTPPKLKFEWTDVEQQAFNDIKCNVSHNTLIAYQYFNKRFDIHTDASDYQFGAVIFQNGKPIAFCGRKLTEMQTGYIVTEAELIRKVETLK